MINLARVTIFGKELGFLRWDTNVNSAKFEYAESFLRQGLEPSPLMMPVQRGRIYSFPQLNPDVFKGLPGMLADSLPDTYGRALFDKWLSLNGRTSSNPVETLCFMGKRSMGALEFEPAVGMGTKSIGSIEIDSLVQVASEALSIKENFLTNINDDRKQAISDILQLGTSAGGQRAKAVIAYNRTTGEVRSGQAEAQDGFEYYLIKLDGVSAELGFRETQNFGRLEYSFYQLAKECGIEMTESSIVEENGRAHFLTKRFDREGRDKLHMQTLCGLAHFDFHLKRGYSYEQAFDILRNMNLPYSQSEELFKRMVLNVAIRNQDDHTKNISFLMDKDGRWRLSPAYDVNYSYNPAGEWTSTHQMSINGKFEDINRKDLIEVAVRNGIKDAGSIIDMICEKTSQWKNTALNCGVPKEMIQTIESNMRFQQCNIY